MVKHETVRPSQRDNCHPTLADFGGDNFSLRLIVKGENIILKLLDSFSSEAVKPFHGQFRKPIKENTKPLLQQPAILNDTDISDNDYPIEIKIQQKDDHFPLFYR